MTARETAKPKQRACGLRIFGAMCLVGMAFLAWSAWVVFWGTPSRVETMATRQFVKFLISDPETLTQLGFIDGRWIDFHSGRLRPRTQAELDRRSALLRRYRAELDRYDPERLDPDQRLTYAVWSWWLDAEIAASEPFYSGPLELGPYVMNQFGLQHSFWNLMTNSHRPSNARLARNYVRRLQAFEQAAIETVALFEDHAERGVLPPRSILERVMADIDRILEIDPADSDLVRSMGERMAETSTLSADRRESFARQAEQAVREQVYPGLRRMRDAVGARLDQARTTNVGMGGLLDGAAHYRASLRQQTSVDIDPRALHRQAMADLARLTALADQMLVSIGRSEGTVAERLETLRAEMRYPVPPGDEGRQALLAIANEWLDRARQDFQPYFNRFPQADVEIVLTPAHAVDSLPSMYLPSSADGARPGTFRYSIPDPQEVSRIGLPRLVVHETIPGHHYQIALQQEIGLPLIRRYLPFPAYSEGWAIYTEGFAREMGFYGDDLAAEIGVIFSQLGAAALHATETGLHHEGWTREQAKAFMREFLPGPEDRIDSTIDRLLAWPAQSLSYHVGADRFFHLRDYAMAALGDDFDIAVFHDQALSAGALPLEILEERIRAWVASLSDAVPPS